jgi:outer membrane usher protein
LTLSTPISFDKSTISTSYVRYVTDDSNTTELITASYSRPLFEKSSLQATGFTDLNDSTSRGFYLGVSMPLDDGISTSAGLNSQRGNVSANLAASKSIGQTPGSWGWRVNDIEGSTPYRNATVGYRATAARVEAGVTQANSGVRSTASVEGAVAMIGGDAYISSRIDDAFAVVDVHAPNVKVERENQLVGTTNEDGKILIPELGSYRKNKISIDPLDLPLNAEPATTYDYVTPGYKSGVYVDFDVKKATPSAIVILKTADGAFVQAGSEGHLDGSDGQFVVGYDGQAYIKDLKPANTIHIAGPKGTCTAAFAFAPSRDAQTTIGPEICK